MKEEHSRMYNATPMIIAIAPGRVNIIGEHTDYNDGLAMPVAINKYVYVSLSKNNTNLINVYSNPLNSKVSVKYNNILFKSNWHKYVLGTIKEVFKTYSVRHGLDVLIYSTLPIGKGVSSSAALVVAIANGLLAIFNIIDTDFNIIKLAQRVDHLHVGINSGTLDQSASQMSRKDSILKIDFNRNSYKYIKSDFSKCHWVLVDSMVRRELANSKYHERVQECKEGLLYLSKSISEEISFRDLSLDIMDDLKKDKLLIFNRLRHVIEENKRVSNMEKAIIYGELEEIGKILIESHESLRDLYSVSCKEIDYIQNLSSRLSCWYGGRIMGGGFGGNTVNLIKKGSFKRYSDYLKINYSRKFGRIPEVYKVEFSDGVEIIDNISAV